LLGPDGAAPFAFAPAVPGVALGETGAVAETLPLTFLAGVTFCRRCNTTVGTSVAAAGAGVLAGEDALPRPEMSPEEVDGVPAGGVVGVLVVVCPEASDGAAGALAAGVDAVTGGVAAPSPGLGDAAGASAPSAAPARGPPRLTAVMPPPARADSIERHARRRGSLSTGMRRSRSSCGRPIVVVGAANPRSRGTPTEIHIGRQPRIRKGIVIAPAIWTPEGEKPAPADLSGAHAILLLETA
jgi:hypothetical protein